MSGSGPRVWSIPLAWAQTPCMDDENAVRQGPDATVTLVYTAGPECPRGGPRPVRTPGADRDRPCTVVVCRGCCCGNPGKNPGTDHQGQLDRLRAAAAASGGRLAVRTSECLGPCAQANLVVVQPSPEGRRRGGRVTWIAWVLGDDSTDEILAWVRAGGPGLAAPPPALEAHCVPTPAEALARAREPGMRG